MESVGWSDIGDLLLGRLSLSSLLLISQFGNSIPYYGMPIKGRAHEFTTEEARQAGKKGGWAISRDHAHMSMLGRKGVIARWRKGVEQEKEKK